MDLFLCMSCVHAKVLGHISAGCVSTHKARRAVKCGFMCPFSDRCLEGDRGLRRHQTTSVCCLCRCCSTTGFDYLLLLECEIWICFSITQSLICGGAGRSEADSKSVRPNWAEFVLVIASSHGLNVCALFRQEAGRKRHFPLYLQDLLNCVFFFFVLCRGRCKVGQFSIEISQYLDSQVQV